MNYFSQGIAATEGLIFIPDISGFTKFVDQMENQRGQEIILELLTSVLKNNTIGLQVSEIEGDAILFHRRGPAPSPWELIAQYETMLAGFRERLDEINMEHNLDINLSLKVIAHYGSYSSYRIGGFEKLYGSAAVEAHQLLKNQVAGESYILLTNRLTAASKTPISCLEQGLNASHLCEIFEDLKTICFTYYNFDRQHCFS